MLQIQGSGLQRGIRRNRRPQRRLRSGYKEQVGLSWSRILVGAAKGPCNRVPGLGFKGLGFNIFPEFRQVSISELSSYSYPTVIRVQ